MRSQDDGGVKCFGDNNEGAVGSGDMLGAGRKAVSVSAVGYYTCVILVPRQRLHVQPTAYLRQI